MTNNDSASLVTSLVGKSVYIEASTPAPNFDAQGRMAGFVFPLTAGQLLSVDDHWLEMLVYNDAERPEKGGEITFYNRQQIRSVRKAPSKLAVAGRDLVLPGRGA